MRACAHLAVAPAAGPSGAARSRISRLHSEPPLVLRPTIATGAEPLARWSLAGAATARVGLVSGAAGPIGGDRLTLTVDVAPGAALVLRAITATLVLPGPHAEPSHSQVAIRVGADATLVWLPGPLIAAAGCDHYGVTRIELDPGARLLVREELVLGRHGESPGSVRQRLRVCIGGQPLHDQELQVGPHVPAWDGPAVTGKRRAIGSLLAVDPEWGQPGAVGPPAAAVGADIARLPLGGPAVLLSALAADALTLRRRLDTALRELESLAPVP